MKFSDKLFQLRRKQGLSQEELGEQLNVTRQTVSKWELGQSKPDTDKLMELSKLLDVDFNQLVDDSIKIETKNINSGVSSDDVRPRKWLLVLLIVIAIGIIIFLLNGYVTNKKTQKENEKNSIFDFFTRFDEAVNEGSSLINNQLYEQYAGTESGHMVESLLDHIITNNKKDEDKAITVAFEDISSTNPEEIKKIKRKLDSFSDYEVSFDYDKKGNIYKATIEIIKGEETVSEFDIKSFNNKYEMFYAGTTNGSSINNMLDDVITNNKTNPNRIIRIIYGSTNTIDEVEIRNLKKNFVDVWTDYEVILDYDDIGFVNQITIEN